VAETNSLTLLSTAIHAKGTPALHAPPATYGTAEHHHAQNTPSRQTAPIPSTR